MNAAFLEHSQFHILFDAVNRAGYQWIGPQVRQGTIVFDELCDLNNIPKGFSDHQQPGNYNLQSSQNHRWFAWSNGPQALKPVLFKPREALWRVETNKQGKLQFKAATSQAKKLAVLGIRACDLAALALHDKHFMQPGDEDPAYLDQRGQLLLVAVECQRSGLQCFCVSTGDGPAIQDYFDLKLVELDEGFILYSGSDLGINIMHKMDLAEAIEQQVLRGKQQTQLAGQQQTRDIADYSRHPLNSDQYSENLTTYLEQPWWNEIAERCLACGNCTSVCPTCFCNDINQQTDATNESATHYREWSSCFTDHHSYMHGNLVRDHTAHRYRQWFTHKLITWHRQYQRSGCVGCGRCITWCPVGIDITKEAKHLDKVNE